MFAIVGFTLLGSQLRVRNGSTNRSGTSALWHGTQQGAAAVVLWSGRSQTTCASQQRVLCGRHRSRRGTSGEFWPLQLRPGAEMLNFGALIAFMGVNLAAFVRYYVREGKHNGIPPLLLTALVIALVLRPGSNVDADDRRRNSIGDPRRVDASTCRVHDLLFPVEESQLEGLDRGKYLDGRRHSIRSVEDAWLPGRFSEFRSSA